jgi:hypothetical protein
MKHKIFQQSNALLLLISLPLHILLHQKMRTSVIAIASCLFCGVDAFVQSIRPTRAFIAAKAETITKLRMADFFEISVDMPPSNSGLQANMKFKSILTGPSEIIQVRYKLPFGLDVAPKDNLAVCTKDGPGGEKVGDILRYTSQWTMGLPAGGGIAATVASFSGGGLGWKCTLFDVMKAPSWEIVVEALTSNVSSRTDEIVMIFERPLVES